MTGIDLVWDDAPISVTTLYCLLPREKLRKGKRKVLGRYRPRSAWARETLLFKMTKKR